MKISRRASSAAYPKNQRVIGVDWQHEHLYLIECRQKNASDFTLMAVNAFAIPPAFSVGTPEFSHFLKEKISLFTGSSGDVRLWALLPEATTEQYYFRIPVVPAKERDSTAVWMAAKDFDLDEKNMVFDCRIGEERVEQGINKLTVSGVAATRVALQQVKDVVERTGYKLEGALSGSAALRNIFASGWVKPSAEYYAVIEVSEEWTRMDIYVQKSPIFSRMLRTGFSSLVRGLLESYTGVPEIGETPKPSPFTEEQLRALLLANANLKVDTNAIVEKYIPDVDERIGGTLERLARQLERTTEHFNNALGYPPVEQFYLATPGGCLKKLRDYLNQHFGIPCLPLRQLVGPMSDRAQNELGELGAEFQDTAWCTGLALAHPAFSLNLLANYEERQKLSKQKRITTLVSLASMGVVGVAAAGWLTLDMEYSGLLDYEMGMQRQLQSMSPPIEELTLTTLSTQVINLRRGMEKVGAKQAGAGLLVELSRLTPELVNISEVQLTTTATPQAASGSATKQGWSAEVSVSGFINGDMLQQEASMADFLYRLEKSPLIFSVSVARKEQPQGVNTVLQFTAIVRLV